MTSEEEEGPGVATSTATAPSPSTNSRVTTAPGRGSHNGAASSSTPCRPSNYSHRFPEETEADEEDVDEEERIVLEERIVEEEKEQEEVVEREQETDNVDDESDGSSDTSVLIVPYPELVPVVFFCLKQTTCPRSLCIRMVSSPYPLKKENVFADIIVGYLHSCLPLKFLNRLNTYCLKHVGQRFNSRPLGQMQPAGDF